MVAKQQDIFTEKKMTTTSVLYWVQPLIKGYANSAEQIPDTHGRLKLKTLYSIDGSTLQGELFFAVANLQIKQHYYLFEAGLSNMHPILSLFNHLLCIKLLNRPLLPLSSLQFVAGKDLMPPFVLKQLFSLRL